MPNKIESHSLPEKPRIALTYIVKDDSEAEFFKKSLESFAPYVDGLYVAITGVSGKFDKIKEIVKYYKGKYITTSPEAHPTIYSKDKDGTLFFSNFAEARNVSWSIVDEGYDYWTWADTDDVLGNGSELLQVAEMAKDKGFDVVHMVYWYANRFNEKGQVTHVDLHHLRERLLKPNKFKWVSRLHEVAVPIDGFQPKLAVWEYDPALNQNLVWVHTATPDKITGAVNRNTQILEVQAEEEQYKDPRTLFYLAKTYFDQQDDKKAEPMLDKYLTMSGWDAERANAWIYKGMILRRSNKINDAIDAFVKGLREYPKHHELYLRLSEAYFELNDVEKATHWLGVASNLPMPKAEATIGNQFELRYLMVALKYKEAYLKNDIDGMLKWAKAKTELFGKDDGLEQAVVSIKNFNTVCNGVFNLAKHLKDSGHVSRIPQLLDLLPSDFGKEPFVHMIANEVMEPKKWGKKSVVYFASFGGPHFEEWGHTSLEKGIGGSETAVIELAKEWAALGYDVTVYCDCGDTGGLHDGVTYKPYYTFNWKDEFNILILWRSPHLVNDSIKAKKLFMDLHDVPSPSQYTPDVVNKLDKIFVKSKYHRSLLPKIPDNKFVIISNGIRA